MSNSTNATLSPMEISAMQAPAHMCWSLFGLVGAACNMIVFLTILKTSELHWKSQFLVASLALADLCRSMSFFGTGLKRYIIYARGRPEIIAPIYCALQTFPMSVLSVVSQDLKLALSIDRLLAIARPVYYHTRPPQRYVSLINTVAWADGILHASVTLIGHNSQLTLSVCTALASYNSWFTPYSNTRTLTATIVTVSLYIVALRKMHVRLKDVAKMNEIQRQEERRKLELGVFHSLLAIVIGHSMTTAVGAVAYFTLPKVSQELTIILAPSLALFLIIDCASHLIIFLLMNPTFRKGTLALFTKKTNQVEEIGNTSKTTADLRRKGH